MKESDNKKSSESYARGYENGLEDGIEEMRLKNAGLYRQLFGEVGEDTLFTAKQLHDIFDKICPLFTPEQLEDIKKQLK